MPACYHICSIYFFNFRHFHWESVIQYVVRLLKLLAVFKLCNDTDGTMRKKLWFSQVAWYGSGFCALRTDSVHLLNCWSAFNIYFPNGLPWCCFSFAMSNKNPLILAQEEPTEEGEGQRLSFFYFETLSDFVHSPSVNMWHGVGLSWTACRKMHLN